MRILLVNRFFGDGHTPTGRMLFDVAKELKAAGHDVSVLTSDALYASSQAAAETSAGLGFHMHVIKHWRRLPRLFNWAWFALQAIVRVPFLRWDHGVFLTDPPFLPIAACVAKRIHGRSRRTFLWSMDLYPEALAASERLSAQSTAYKLLKGVSNLAIQGMDGVISLGTTQLRRLRQYRSWRDGEMASTVISPWDDRSIPKVARADNPLIKRFGWANVKLAIYAGNLGEGHTFLEFVDAAKTLAAEGRTDWRFGFFVRGSGVAALKEEVFNLPNVLVDDYVSDSETAALLWAADVHLISMKTGWEGVIVPSKLYGVLKTDAPVLFIGPYDADTSIAIRRLGCGLQLSPAVTGKTVMRALDGLYERKRDVPIPIEEAAKAVAAFVIDSTAAMDVAPQLPIHHTESEIH